MNTYLDKILEIHRFAAREDSRSTDALVEKVSSVGPTRGFAQALKDGSELSVIAEIKRRSPSKGDLFADLDPTMLAAEYESAGAGCISVLTDEEFFGGSVSDLQAARAAVSVPILRKDFTVSANDVVDTRLMGADCVLLIAAALDNSEMSDLASLASELGLEVLVEVHDEAEVERAIANVEVALVGVNQRDLVTFEVDQDRAVRVAGEIPEGVVKVAESGVTGRADAEALAGAGYEAVLVGEHLVTAENPSETLTDLRVPRN